MDGERRKTIVLGMVHHTCSLRIMKKAVEEFVKYGTTEDMRTNHYYDGPSQGPLIKMRLDIF